MHYYDVHTHIGLDLGFYLRGWWPYASTAQDLLQQLSANRIDRAVVFPFALPSAFDPYTYADRLEVSLIPGRVPFDRENLALVKEVQRIDRERRLFVLAMFDPSRRVTEQVRLLEALKGRISGLKLQGTVLQSKVTDLLTVGRPLMEFAETEHYPVLFHTSINPSDPWAQTADCLKVAEAFPKVRFNLAHSHRFHAPTLRLAAQMPNVWVDCSAHLVHCQGALDNGGHVAAPAERVDADYTKPSQVLEAVYDIVGPKYMWGSDNPYMSWCDDNIVAVYTYKQEADTLHALPQKIRDSMASHAPQAWLFGAAG